MKNFDKLLKRFDRHIDRFIAPVWSIIKRYFMLISGALLMTMATVFIIRIIALKKDTLISVVHQDIAHLAAILARIDKDCEILDIRTDHAHIDFLTVKNFSGSTIGCLNLAHPKRWKGPYIEQNPTVQGHLYQVVRAHDGYFVVPGDGVTLPNKSMMGKDVKITKKTMVTPMLKQGGLLNNKGQALGIRLNFKIGPWTLIPAVSHQEVDQINDFLKEFNGALPFALGRHNHHA